MHWVADYIGRRWVNGELDCYQFVRLIYKEQLNIELPAVPINANNLAAVVRAFQGSEARNVWRRTGNPVNMGLVFMGRTRSSHCGLYIDIDGGGILSSYQDSGAVFESLTSINRRQFKVFEWFEYAS